MFEPTGSGGLNLFQSVFAEYSRDGWAFMCSDDIDMRGIKLLAEKNGHTATILMISSEVATMTPDYLRHQINKVQLKWHAQKIEEENSHEN